MYSVCVHAPVYVRMCVMYCTCPYSSQLQKKKLWFKFSRALSTQATVRQMQRCAFPFHTQIVCKGPALFMLPRVGSPQANLLADGDSLSGFIGSVNLPRARSLSLYVNSSAFHPAPLWILICMRTHCVAEWGNAQQRGTILGVDVVG